MYVSVISDIHSNLPALKAVLEEVEKENPDYILCLGDIVGYGAEPNEVCEELRGMDNLIAVRGNHDHAVLTEDVEGLNEQAAEVAEWTREEIGRENLEFLDSLKNYRALELDGLHVFAAHGSPDDYLDEYVHEDTPEERFERFFDETKAHMIATGHTHMPFVKEVGVRLFLNAGSVGQPRDRDRRACYVMMDTEEPSVTIERVPYDVEEAAEAIINSGLPDQLGERLYYGR